jgi:predicted DNA-binding transcriptional regulator AlpA
MEQMTHHDSRPQHRVRPLAERAEQAGVSKWTLWRLIRAGEGPVITQLSARCRGIRDDHWQQWLDSRAGKPAE